MEVAGSTAVHQVADAVRTMCPDEGVIGTQRPLEHVLPSVDAAALLPLGDQRADAGWRVERGDASTARAHPLGERSLRNEFQLDLARLYLLLDRGSARRVGRERGELLADEIGVGPRLRRARTAARLVEYVLKVKRPVLTERDEEAVGRAIHHAEP